MLRSFAWREISPNGLLADIPKNNDDRAEIVMHRIDKAVAPAGLIRSAKCYTLIIHDGYFYMLKTGTGWMLSFHTQGALNNMVANKAIQYRINKATEGEKRISEASLSELAEEKGSFRFRLEEVEIIKFQSFSGGVSDLKFSAAGKKRRVQFAEGREAEVEEFMQQMRAT